MALFEAVLDFEHAHPRGRGGKWMRKPGPGGEVNIPRAATFEPPVGAGDPSKWVFDDADTRRAWAEGQASPAHSKRAEYRMRSAAAILHTNKEIPDAVLKLPDESSARTKLVEMIAKGDVARAQKEFSRTPLGDLEALSGIEVLTKPAHGRANANLSQRTVQMGSTSMTGDFRHELGHTLRAAMGGGGGPSAKSPLTKYVAERHEVSRKRRDENIKLGKPKPKTELEWEHAVGIISPRALDNWEEDFAEQYRGYHRAVFRATTPDAPDHDPDSMKKYRELHPEWTRLWDAWYTAQLVGRTPLHESHKALAEAAFAAGLGGPLELLEAPSGF